MLPMKKVRYDLKSSDLSTVVTNSDFDVHPAPVGGRDVSVPNATTTVNKEGACSITFGLEMRYLYYHCCNLQIVQTITPIVP